MLENFNKLSFKSNEDPELEEMFWFRRAVHEFPNGLRISVLQEGLSSRSTGDFTVPLEEVQFEFAILFKDPVTGNFSGIINCHDLMEELCIEAGINQPPKEKGVMFFVSAPQIDRVMALMEQRPSLDPAKDEALAMRARLRLPLGYTEAIIA